MLFYRKNTIDNQVGKVKLFEAKPSNIPFPYQVSVNSRAKRLNLKLSANKGVQLVVPKRVSQKAAMAFLQQHVEWIQGNAHIWEQAYVEIERPELIVLPVLGQWRVEYETNVISKRATLLHRPDNSLIYCGKDDPEIIFKKLHQWIHKQAAPYLHERMQHLSQRCELPFNKLTFRTQNTRWGSCSHEKNISLNYKLIFMDEDLIDYVLIHELAHTVHLDHGKRFWGLVSEHFPNYRLAIKQLKYADSIIPNWF